MTFSSVLTAVDSGYLLDKQSVFNVNVFDLK